MQIELCYSDRVLPVLRRAISPPRLGRYVGLANGDSALALRLYYWNTALAEALYGPLLSVEVTLRNAVNERMRVALGAAWYDNPLAELRSTQLQQIHDAKRSLSFAGKSTEPSNVIASLSLGFWVALFGRKYETTLWRKHLRWIFARAPKVLLRSTVQERLERIRRLRNRVAHYEPVLHSPLAEDYGAILELISWLCLATWVYTARQGQLTKVLRDRPKNGAPRS